MEQKSLYYCTFSHIFKGSNTRISFTRKLYDKSNYLQAMHSHIVFSLLKWYRYDEKSYLFHQTIFTLRKYGIKFKICLAKKFFAGIARTRYQLILSDDLFHKLIVFLLVQFEVKTTRTLWFEFPVNAM